MVGIGSPSLIKYCFCHMNWIDFKPISLGFSGMEFKNANGFLLIFWLLVNHTCAEPDSVLIKVDQIKNKSYPYVSLESRNKLSPCHLLFIMYFRLCTMHNQTQESDALEVANKNAQ